MTRGLVRKNNLSDLPSPEQARTNLGLATADYNRIRGLYASAGVSNLTYNALQAPLVTISSKLIASMALLAALFQPSMQTEQETLCLALGPTLAA
jgi:hypothetical protein